MCVCMYMCACACERVCECQRVPYGMMGCVIWDSNWLAPVEFLYCIRFTICVVFKSNRNSTSHNSDWPGRNLTIRPECKKSIGDVKRLHWVVAGGSTSKFGGSTGKTIHVILSISLTHILPLF